MKENNSKIRKAFISDLYLAKCFLIVESIEANTFDRIRLLAIKVAQGIGNSDAVKHSQILKLNDAAKVAHAYVQKSFSIKDQPTIQAFRERAGKLIAALEFYYLLEDLATTLLNESMNIEKAFEEYKNNAAIAAEAGEEGEESEEDPTLEVILGRNESKNMILRLMKVFRKQVQITKDVPTIKFSTAVKDLKNAAYTVIPAGNQQVIAIKITQLTYSQFQNLIKILQTLGMMTSKIRLSIGSAQAQEIRKELLGEPK